MFPVPLGPGEQRHDDPDAATGGPGGAGRGSVQGVAHQGVHDEGIQGAAKGPRLPGRPGLHQPADQRGVPDVPVDRRAPPPRPAARRWEGLLLPHEQRRDVGQHHHHRRHDVRRAVFGPSDGEGEGHHQGEGLECGHDCEQRAVPVPHVRSEVRGCQGAAHAMMMRAKSSSHNLRKCPRFCSF